MTTAQPNNYVYTRRPDLTGVGVLLLAGSWMLVIGLLNLFYAISVIAGSTIFITKAAWLVGDAHPLGRADACGLPRATHSRASSRGGGGRSGSVSSAVLAKTYRTGHVHLRSRSARILILGLDAMVLGCMAILLEKRSAR